jgi:hypothetical protein
VQLLIIDIHLRKRRKNQILHIGGGERGAQRCTEPLKEMRGRAFKVLRSRTRDALAGWREGHGEDRQECVARDCLSRISVSPSGKPGPWPPIFG